MSSSSGLLERLLADPEFRARFRSDPAGAARQAGFDELATELETDRGKPFQTLEARESRSGLAGVMVAAAIEGLALFEVAEHVPQLGAEAALAADTNSDDAASAEHEPAGPTSDVPDQDELDAPDEHQPAGGEPDRDAGDAEERDADARDEQGPAEALARGDEPDEQGPAEAGAGADEPDEQGPAEAQFSGTEPDEQGPAEAQDGGDEPDEEEPDEEEPDEEEPDEEEPDEEEPDEEEPDEEEPDEEEPDEEEVDDEPDEQEPDQDDGADDGADGDAEDGELDADDGESDDPDGAALFPQADSGDSETDGTDSGDDESSEDDGAGSGPASEPDADWKPSPDQYGMAGGGGARSPIDAAVLKNSYITLDANGKQDFAKGRMDPRVGTLLLRLAERHKITLSATTSDHPQNTGGGSPSNHWYGRAVDIATVDGEIVRPGSAAGRKLAMELTNLDPSFRPDEIGSPWAIGAPGFFSDADHQDHIHVAFDKTISRSWAPSDETRVMRAIRPHGDDDAG